MVSMKPTTTPSPTEDPSPSLREINFEYSRNVSRILEHVQASLLISTYQAGKLVVVGVRRGKVEFSFHTLEQAMGVAVRRDRIAVSSRALI
jgi:hypothetical protein